MTYDKFGSRNSKEYTFFWYIYTKEIPPFSVTNEKAPPDYATHIIYMTHYFNPYTLILLFCN